jgi:hypothetical protein
MASVADCRHWRGAGVSGGLSLRAGEAAGRRYRAGFGVCAEMIKCINGWWYLVNAGAFHGYPFPTRADAAEALQALGAQA